MNKIILLLLCISQSIMSMDQKEGRETFTLPIFYHFATEHNLEKLKKEEGEEKFSNLYSLKINQINDETLGDLLRKDLKITWFPIKIISDRLGDLSFKIENSLPARLEISQKESNLEFIQQMPNDRHIICVIPNVTDKISAISLTVLIKNVFGNTFPTLMSEVLRKLDDLAMLSDQELKKSSNALTKEFDAYFYEIVQRKTCRHLFRILKLNPEKALVAKNKLGGGEANEEEKKEKQKLLDVHAVVDKDQTKNRDKQQKNKSRVFKFIKDNWRYLCMVVSNILASGLCCWACISKVEKGHTSILPAMGLLFVNGALSGYFISKLEKEIYKKVK